jgi:hypothetical protein
MSVHDKVNDLLALLDRSGLVLAEKEEYFDAVVDLFLCRDKLATGTAADASSRSPSILPSVILLAAFAATDDVIAERIVAMTGKLRMKLDGETASDIVQISPDVLSTRKPTRKRQRRD